MCKLVNRTVVVVIRVLFDVLVDAICDVTHALSKAFHLPQRMLGVGLEILHAHRHRRD